MASNHAARVVGFDTVGQLKLISNPRSLERAPRDRAEAVALVRESIRPAERPELAEQMSDGELEQAVKAVVDLTLQYQAIWGSFEDHS